MRLSLICNVHLEEKIKVATPNGGNREIEETETIFGKFLVENLHPQPEYVDYYSLWCSQITFVKFPFDLAILSQSAVVCACFQSQNLLVTKTHSMHTYIGN